MLTISRHLASGLAVFNALSALGGLILGVQLTDGRFLAVACLSAGMALACGLWWRMAAQAPYVRMMKGLFLAIFCVIAGLAMYSNLAYLLWIAGYPLAIGTVASGKMGENYWLPPATLLYAVFLYMLLHQSAKRR
jgi:hypothetical protein